MILFKQMLVLLLVMLVGFAAAKTGMMDEASNKKISGIVANIANPAMIISGGIDSDITITEFLKIFLLATIIFLILILLSYVVTSFLHVSVDKAGMYRCMFSFSNIGFMGFPLVQAMYGNKAVLYASIFVLPFNVLIYTFGIIQVGNVKKFSIRKIFNSGVIACICALLITVLRISIPGIIQSTLSYLSDLTSPLSMMVIGASFVSIKVKDLISDIRLDVFIVLKMLVVPIIGIIILKMAGINGMLLGVCMVVLATPVASLSAILAQQYDGDYLTATKGIALSTICSVITMPIVSLLLV